MDLFQSTKEYENFPGRIQDTFYEEDSARGRFLFHFSMPLINNNTREWYLLAKKFQFLTESDLNENISSNRWRRHPIPISPQGDFDVRLKFYLFFRRKTVLSYLLKEYCSMRIKEQHA